MKRKIYQTLLDWKQKRKGEVALLIKGARRIGKSYIVEKFAKEQYESYIMIDFLISKPVITSRHNISPIEVKSSTRYTLSSLRKCINKYGNYLSTAYVIHSKDLEIKENIVFIPLYMTPLL